MKMDRDDWKLIMVVEVGSLFVLGLSGIIHIISEDLSYLSFLFLGFLFLGINNFCMILGFLFTRSEKKERERINCEKELYYQRMNRT